MDHRVPMWALGLQWAYWDSNVALRNSLYIMVLQYGSWDSSYVGLEISVKILGSGHSSFVSKVNPGIPVWIIGFSVWIIGFQCGYWDNNAYFEILV